MSSDNQQKQEQITYNLLDDEGGCYAIIEGPEGANFQEFLTEFYKELGFVRVSNHGINNGKSQFYGMRYETWNYVLEYRKGKNKENATIGTIFASWLMKNKKFKNLKLKGVYVDWNDCKVLDTN